MTLAAHELRGAGFVGALRWLRRRIRLVQQTLTVIVTMMPETFAGCAATLEALRAHLGLSADECVLARLREIAATHLAAMPPPVGFGPRTWAASSVKHSHPHEAGPAPPGPRL